MRFAADAVEDHAGDAQVAIEGREPVDLGGHRAAHGRRVDDEDHRRVEKASDVGGAGVVARGGVGGPVEQPHDAFHDQDVGGVAGSRREWGYGVWP